MTNRLFELIKNDAALCAELNKTGSFAEAYALVAARLPGYTEAELDAELKALSQSAELTDEQVAAVAGGADSKDQLTRLKGWILKIVG